MPKLTDFKTYWWTAQSYAIAIIQRRHATQDEDNVTLSLRERQIRKGHWQINGFLQAVFVTVLTDRFAWVALWFYAWNKDGGVSILPQCSSALAHLELTWEAYLGICLIPCYVMFIANINAQMAAKLKTTTGKVCACFSLFLSPFSVTIMITFYAIYLFFLLWLERCMMNCFPDDGPLAGPSISCESDLWQAACPRHGLAACYSLLLKMYVRFRQTLYYITLTLIMIIAFLIIAFVWSCHLRLLMHAKEVLRSSMIEENELHRARTRTCSRHTTGFPDDDDDDAEPTRSRSRTLSRRPTLLTSADNDAEPTRSRTRTSSRRLTALSHDLADPTRSRDRHSSRRRSSIEDRARKKVPMGTAKYHARASLPKRGTLHTRRAQSPRRGSSPQGVNLSPRRTHDKHMSARRLPRARPRQPDRLREGVSSSVAPSVDELQSVEAAPSVTTQRSDDVVSHSAGIPPSDDVSRSPTDASTLVPQRSMKVFL